MPEQGQSRPLRILIVSYEYPPIGGGGASALQSILKHLASNPNHQILVVTSSPDSERHVLRMGESVLIHRLPVQKRDLFYWRRLEVLRFIKVALAYCRDLLNAEPWDMAVGFFGFPSGLIPWRYRKRLPYIVLLRGSDVPGFNPRFGIDYLFLRPLFKRIWRGAVSVAANSRKLVELASQTCPELEFEIVRNGVDCERFRVSEEPPADGPVRLAVAARLIPRKAVHQVLEVLHDLAEGVSPWILNIYGDGPERPRLEAMSKEFGLKDRVFFHGHIDRSEMAERLASADLFVMPSLWEGMSNAVLEAMACGLPVIVTKTGGAEELVSDNGFVITPGDTDELATALGKLIDNPEARRAMGLRSREHAESMSWDKTADKFLELCYRAAGVSSGS